jgi:hypothetical protein
MKKILFILIFGIASLQSNEIIQIDDDFDGVVDIYDKCLNTPFEYEVDKNGCKIDDESFDKTISFETTYYKLKDNNYKYDYRSNSLSFYLENNRYIFGIKNNYINLIYTDSENTKNKEHGLSDTYLDFGYKFKHEYLQSINLLSKISTSSNQVFTTGKNDYSIEMNLKNEINDYAMFSSIAYNYTTNTSDAKYNNYFDINVGFVDELDDFGYAISLYYSQPVTNQAKPQKDFQISFAKDIGYDYRLSFSYVNSLDNTTFDNGGISIKLVYGF